MASMTFVLPAAPSLAGPAVRKEAITSTKPLDFLRSLQPLSPPPRFEAAAV